MGLTEKALLLDSGSPEVLCGTGVGFLGVRIFFKGFLDC